jgi:hypothetical protein
MKLGLITDIHEQVDELAIALDRLHERRVDRIVFLGDVFAMGERIEETCCLLDQANVVGVWGNHDFGLCGNPSEELRSKFPESVVDYLATLRPKLEIDDCFFCHIEPWLDPENITDLWFFEGPPDNDQRVRRIFNATTHRLIFAGHYHRWMLVTRQGISDWMGESSIRLADDRYFVVINALTEGQFATFDTETSELIPLNVERS